LLGDEEADPPPLVLLEAEPLPPLPEVPPVPESEELDDEVDLELPPPPGFTTVVLRSSQAASASAPSRANINACIFMSSTPCLWIATGSRQCLCLGPNGGRRNADCYAQPEISPRIPRPALDRMTISARRTRYPVLTAIAAPSYDQGFT
jgi:hypothetical protein